MRIAFFEINEGEQDFFTTQLPGHTLSFFHEPLNTETAQKALEAEVVCVFVGSCADESTLALFKNLKAVVTRSTGTDHISSAYCSERHIAVLNVAHYGINTVAEHTIALILAMSRNIVKSVEQTRKGVFTNEHLTGFDLNGKTLGIIGYGNIGGRVAELALAFHMNILCFTRTPKEVPCVSWVSLEELLQKSDIITLHAPLTPETQHLINMNNIKLIKKGALLVNAARGGLVETEALVHALEEKILSGAALDVLEEEQAVKQEKEAVCRNPMDIEAVRTLLMDHVLRDFENVIITPHNAFNSKEAVDEINHKTVENILSIKTAV